MKTFCRITLLLLGAFVLIVHANVAAAAQPVPPAGAGGLGGRYVVVVSQSATPTERQAGALLEAAGFRVQGSGIGRRP